MRKYTVMSVFAVPPGAALAISGKQAAPRAHLLKAVKVDPKSGDGVYEVLARTEFKVGEVISTDAELNKREATQLQLLASDVPKKA